MTSYKQKVQVSKNIYVEVLIEARLVRQCTIIAPTHIHVYWWFGICLATGFITVNIISTEIVVVVLGVVFVIIICLAIVTMIIATPIRYLFILGWMSYSRKCINRDRGVPNVQVAHPVVTISVQVFENMGDLPVVNLKSVKKVCQEEAEHS